MSGPRSPKSEFHFENRAIFQIEKVDAVFSPADREISGKSGGWSFQK